MIELIFVACISAAPGQASDSCREHSLLFTGGEPMGCMLSAPRELARWTETHPAHRIRNWTCRVVNPAEQDA